MEFFRPPFFILPFFLEQGGYFDFYTIIFFFPFTVFYDKEWLEIVN